MQYTHRTVGSVAEVSPLGVRAKIPALYETLSGPGIVRAPTELHHLSWLQTCEMRSYIDT